MPSYVIYVIIKIIIYSKPEVKSRSNNKNNNRKIGDTSDEKYGEDELSAIWELVDVELQRTFPTRLVALVWRLITCYIDDSRAILMGNSEFKRNIIEKRYLGVIEDAFEAVLGFRVSVSLRLSSEQNSVNSGNTGVAAPLRTMLTTELILTPA